MSLGTIDTATVVEIQIDGILTAHHTWPPESYGSVYWSVDASGWFDDGFFYACYAYASVRYSGQGYFYPSNSGCPTPKAPPVPGSRPHWVDTVLVRGTGTASRTSGIPYFGSNCNNGPCYYYTGEQTITITPVATTLQLAADPTDGPAGRTVTYTASTSNGNTFTVKEWTFVPDDTTSVAVRRVGPGATGVRASVVRSAAMTSDSGGPGPCVPPATTCGEVVAQSGTMYVRASVLGIIQQARVHVSVQGDSLLLTPSSDTVYPGETATFVASTRFGTPFTVQGWSWSASAPPVLTMIPESCDTNVTCTLPAFESGVITVVATFQGSTAPDTATAVVVATPCPPIDSPDGVPEDTALNSVSFRESLLEKRQAGNVDDSLKRGTRHEVGGVFWRDSTTGEWRAAMVRSAAKDTTCSYALGNYNAVQASRPGKNWVLDNTRQWHLHPFIPGDTIYGCRRHGVAGDSASGSPSDSSDKKKGDWNTANTAHATSYIMDAAGKIMRINYPPGEKPNNRHEYHWVKDDKSVCYTPYTPPNS
ncbi:MAG TPA: hypothetical protein VF166_00405 [Gemmatimonadaceae bacterium]